MSGSQKAVAAGLLAGLGQGMVDVAKQKTETTDKVILMEAERMHAEGLARLKNQWDKENLKTEHENRMEGVRLDQAGNLAVEGVRSTNEGLLLDKRLGGEKALQDAKIASEEKMHKEDVGAGKWSGSGTDTQGRRINWLLDSNNDEIRAVTEQIDKGVVKRDVGAKRIASLEREAAALRAVLAGQSAPSAEPAPAKPPPMSTETYLKRGGAIDATYWKYVDDGQITNPRNRDW